MKFYTEKRQTRLSLWPWGNMVHVGRSNEVSFWARWLPKKLAKWIYDQCLKFVTKLPSFFVDFIEGFVSGIPICCVFYFSRKSKGQKIPTWLDYDWEEIPFWLLYVPCPYCFSRARWAHKMEDVWSPILSVQLNRREINEMQGMWLSERTIRRIKEAISQAT